MGNKDAWDAPRIASTVPTGRGSAPRPLAAAGGSAAAARPGQIFFFRAQMYIMYVCMYV